MRNWIEAAEAGKLQLTLHEENGKYFIANTAANIHQVEKLVLKGRKFKNSRGSKIVTPSPAFYRYLSSKEIFDLISNLDIHHEIDPGDRREAKRRRQGVSAAVQQRPRAQLQAKPIEPCACCIRRLTGHHLGTQPEKQRRNSQGSDIHMPPYPVMCKNRANRLTAEPV